MRGYASQGASVFEVGPVAGETLSIAGVACAYRGDAEGYFGSVDGFAVFGRETAGGCYVSIATAQPGDVDRLMVIGRGATLDIAVADARNRLAIALIITATVKS